MKMEQSVSKRRHIKFRRRGITEKKMYNIFTDISGHLSVLSSRVKQSKLDLLI